MTGDGLYHSKVDPPGHNHFWVSHSLAWRGAGRPACTDPRPSAPPPPGQDAVRRAAGSKALHPAPPRHITPLTALSSARYQRCDLRTKVPLPRYDPERPSRNHH